jgi:hypothetical protein
LDPIFAPLLQAQAGSRQCDSGGQDGNRVGNADNADDADNADNALEPGYCRPLFGCFLKDYFATEW